MDPNRHPLSNSGEFNNKNADFTTLVGQNLGLITSPKWQLTIDPMMILVEICNAIIFTSLDIYRG